MKAGFLSMICLAGALVPAHSQVTAYGSSGIFFTPTARVAPERAFHIGYLSTDGDKTLFFNADTNDIGEKRFDLNAIPMLFRIGKSAEFGVSIFYAGERRQLQDIVTGETQDLGGWRGMESAKVLLTPPHRDWAVSAGILDMFGAVQRTPYIVAGATLNAAGSRHKSLPPIDFGVGWGNGLIRDYFINWNVHISPSFEFVGEWTQNRLAGVFSEGRQVNMGLRFHPPKAEDLSLQIGATDYHSVFVGFDYAFK